MGFNDQAKALQGGRGSRKFIFKDGVKFRHMSGAQPILFRFLPAFNPNDPNPKTSYLPSLDPSGNLTDWGTVLQIVRFVGHGTNNQNRQDLLSLKTFESGDQQIWCPLAALYQTITEDQNVWGYLIVDHGERDDKNRTRKSFDRAAKQLVANILDVNQVQDGIKLGVFTTGASAKIIDRGEGLVYQPNASPGVEEYVKQNYMYAYANGDLTDPNTAPCLICEKGKDKGDFSAYQIRIAQDSARKVIRRPLDQSMMEQRQNLANLANIINIPTEEELVQSLIALLNGRSPLGYHEFALLKLAFPQFRIPEPPAAPAAMPTIQAGFAQSPAAQGVPPQQGGYQGVPQFTPPAQLQPASSVPAAGWPPPAGSAGAPQVAPVQTVSQVAVPSQGVPAAAGWPGQLPVAPQVAPPPAQQGAEMAGVAANAAQAAQAAHQAPSEPVAPGDPVAQNFNQAEFLARLRATKQ